MVFGICQLRFRAVVCFEVELASAQMLAAAAVPFQLVDLDQTFGRFHGVAVCGRAFLAADLVAGMGCRGERDLFQHVIAALDRSGGDGCASDTAGSERNAARTQKHGREFHQECSDLEFALDIERTRAPRGSSIPRSGGAFAMRRSFRYALGKKPKEQTPP